MNLHATHLADYDSNCLVCTNEARWGVTPGRTLRDVIVAAGQPPNPDPLRPPETDDPWADEDADDVRVAWIGAVLMLLALLVGVVIGVQVGWWTA